MSSPDTTTDQASATDPGEPAVDERRGALVNSLTKTLGDALVAAGAVAPRALLEVLTVVRVLVWL